MKRFQNLPIRRKLLVMTLLICGTVLLVAISAFLAFQVLSFRSNFERDTSTLAAIIATDSTTAMSSRDDATAMEIVVHSLHAKQNVVAATLTLADGTILAHYGLREHQDVLARYPQPGTFRFSAGHLLFTQPVEVQKDRLGTLYLHMDYERTFQELITYYEKIIAGVMLVSISLAVLLSGLLGRTITRPVLELAETAKIIGEKKDYSVRAALSSRGDELGRLAESFNEMLGRIRNAGRRAEPVATENGGVDQRD